jgi:hypothetical protein
VPVLDPGGLVAAKAAAWRVNECELLGPIVGGLAMELLGPIGLPLCLAATFTLLLAARIGRTRCV